MKDDYLRLRSNYDSNLRMRRVRAVSEVESRYADWVSSPFAQSRSATRPAGESESVGLNEDLYVQACEKR